MERREAIQNLALLILAVVVIVGGSFFLDVPELRELVARAGFWGPLTLVVLKASTMVFAPLSGSPLYPLAGAIFGPVYGFLYIMLGDMLGAALSFALSRFFGRGVIARLLSRGNLVFLETVLSYIGTIKGFIIARIIFSPVPEVVSYAAGLTSLPFVPFFIIHSLIGTIPAGLLVWFCSSISLAQSPLGLSAILLIGSIVMGVCVFVFFKCIQPRAIKEENTKHAPID